MTSYFNVDTIAAASTALGGAVSIVRISGPEAEAGLLALTGKPADAFDPRKLVRARLRDGETPLDEALAVRFPAPDSFTGEDVVELHLHGGGFIAHSVLEALGKKGVRQALPGEFSFRAVRNGKIGITEAQAVADLVRATNSEAVRLALEKASGSQNTLLSKIAGGLRETAVLAEAGIDFSDQDIEEVSLPRLKSRLASLQTELQKLERSFERGIRIQEGIRVAFIGLPNAGKSSFFNAVLGEDRSIVSSTAGTTRDVIHELLTLKGRKSSITLRLEDTAGLRSADDEVESMGIARSREASSRADLVLFLVDCKTDLDSALRQWRLLGAPRDKTLGILTKTDLVSSEEKASLAPQLALFDIGSWIPTSALTGDGIAEGIEKIMEFCEQWIRRSDGEVLLTRIDQLNSVTRALKSIARALSAPEHALFAADLRVTLNELGSLIGETPADEILGQIFSNFCIGK